MSDTIDGGWGPPPGLRLHIIRHGDPDYANDWLTPRGHAEAAALAHRADELALDRLFVSPMGRARATAAPLAQACGLDAVVADWAGEFRSPTVPDGDGGTAVFWNVSGRYVRAAGAQPWQSWSVFDGHAPAIEAEIERLVQGSRGFLESLGYRRCDAGFERVSEEVEDLSVAIVCHGGLGVTWLADLLDIPIATAWTSLFLPVTSVSTVVFETRQGGRVHVPRAVRIGDTSHLFAAGLGLNHAGLPGARQLD
ncbi:MAG TPA: histidine phosphatase family protein [Actinotalea caeni]|uniref:histidine phosphatase family protein n=1 Tax=Actinotalea caeni TaxID=1348467 RepID=UPI002B4B7A1C|nr:histidine phosphatase family protein [Actinotalea caeni]HLV54851.1 histidine phosphatase family protein [Actinotalea caeni]